MKFDARSAKQLKPKDDEPIDGFPGLRIIVTATRKSWTYRYKSPVDGLMKQSKLGEWPAMSLATAIKEWETARTARAAGADMASEKRQKRQGGDEESTLKVYDVRTLCSDYEDGYIDSHRKPKGAANVRRMFRTYLKPIQHLQPSEVTRTIAFDLINLYKDSPTSAELLRRELGAAWEYALDSGKLPETVPNWWRRVMRGQLKMKSKGKKVGGVRVKDRRVLSDAELKILIPWFNIPSQTLCDCLTLYLWTCTRGAEIVKMEGREISDESDGCWWTVPKAKTKNANNDYATDLRVPLIGRAEKLVKARVKMYGKGWLFPGNKLPHIEQNTLQNYVYQFQPYSKHYAADHYAKLEVTHWAPHDLRRTGRTKLSALKCPREVAEAILGHVAPGIVGVYDRHTYDAERREWLGKLDRYWESILTPAAV